MTCMKQEFCIHEKYCQRHIGQNFDSCLLFSRNSKPITNEEWIKSLDTEELAEFIRQQRDDWSDGWYSDCHRFEEIVEWLKQPHTEKE